MTIDLAQFALIFVCLAMGGVLKGATGAGAPILAVPALAMVFDVKFAVVVMLMPNLLTNMWQGWLFRAHRLPSAFVWSFALAGGAGALIGTFMLASFSPAILSMIVAAAVLFYVLLRIGKPNWKIAYPFAERLSIPAGMIAGMLQGSSGISAPVSITFLNAIRLERPFFISTISVFFAVMTALQIASLGYVGILSWKGLAISLAAMAPILAFMPVGSALARRFSKETFDRAILILLSLLSVKLIYEALFS
ncbi:sulfite exporter TauE/SafE family protein [Aquamicrobium sp. LC103]|uniref:sulfite exporter TauE/SafE family protein n=1 Tax=Aquamicrobium sp. LC103 TaxID=1120658 RepID=UPI00063E774F|nr:sulfite exporter TauE/SafE family protein [Aquamicrobium sp. LC103]TKT69666.1 sulfite exporter TauE/SafE family protein [Aquamicrobium sp. LC103]